MIEFDTLAATNLRTEPYEWALVESSLDPARSTALIDTFPTAGFWQIAGHDGEKSYTYDARPLVILGADRVPALAPLSEAWQEVAADLLSPRYREALSLATGRSLDGALMEANIWRWPNAAHLGPHLDMDKKILTQVFYLNGGWNAWWGGCLRILDAQDEQAINAEIPPLLGNASILVRSERSWHSVSPVTAAPVPRRSLIVTWFHPGCESPTWYEDTDGVVRTHAEPPGAIRHEAPLLPEMAALEAHAAATDARCVELSAAATGGDARTGLSGRLRAVAQRRRR